jgi:hypothetical protein
VWWWWWWGGGGVKQTKSFAIVHPEEREPNIRTQHVIVKMRVNLFQQRPLEWARVVGAAHDDAADNRSPIAGVPKSTILCAVTSPS